MTISIVNGYTCETSCEVAKARTGQDPHPGRHDTVEGQGGTAAYGVSAFDRPAVIFGGSLADTLSATAIAPAGTASKTTDVSTRPPANTVDLLI